MWMEWACGGKEKKCAADFFGAVQGFPGDYPDCIGDYFRNFRRRRKCGGYCDRHYNECNFGNRADGKSRAVASEPEKAFRTGGEGSQEWYGDTDSGKRTGSWRCDPSGSRGLCSGRRTTDRERKSEDRWKCTDRGESCSWEEPGWNRRGSAAWWPEQYVIFGKLCYLRTWKSRCDKCRYADRSRKDCRTFEINIWKADSASGESGRVRKEAFGSDPGILRNLVWNQCISWRKYRKRVYVCSSTCGCSNPGGIKFNCNNRPFFRNAEDGQGACNHSKTAGGRRPWKCLRDLFG